MSWIHGVDVSGHQGVIDWAEVPEFVRFCYIKVAEGSGSQRKHKGAAERNFAGARGRDIAVGAYSFGRPDTHTNIGMLDARREADSLLTHARYVPGDLPPALDLERAVKPDDTYNAEWCLEWGQHVMDALGLPKLVLYTTSPSYYAYLQHAPRELLDRLGEMFWLFWAEYPRKKGHPNSGINNDFDFCSARPPRKLKKYDDPWNDQVSIWQWTGYGRLPGFRGNVDRNVMLQTSLDALRAA